MPTIAVNDVDIYYEVTGQGVPLVLLHEYATDMRAWESQVRFFSRFYQVISFNNRGYPPSTVPTDAGSYLHDRLIEDIDGLLDGLGIRFGFNGTSTALLETQRPHHMGNVFETHEST